MFLPFNSLNVDIATVGNHELDLGLAAAKKLIAETNCPWVIANLLSKAGGNKPICDLPPYFIKEYQGFKIGFIGFAGEDWLGCLT